MWFTTQTVLNLLSREANQRDVQGVYYKWDKKPTYLHRKFPDSGTSSPLSVTVTPCSFMYFVL